MKDPIISNITPSFGPMSGGTTLTVIGKYFQAALSHVYIGQDVVCPVTDSNMTYGAAKTPQVGVPFRDTTHNMIVEFNDGLNITTPFTFTFKGDPEIDLIRPQITIVQGGSTITVTGKSMNSVAEPVMKMTVAATFQYKVNNDTFTNETIFEEVCDLGSSSKMFCKTPPIPRGLLPLDDNYNEDDQVISTSVHVGFLFDGVTEFTDLRTHSQLREYSEFTVIQTPAFQFEGGALVLKFEPEELIFIPGKNVLKFPPSDFKVTIGQGICDIKELLSSGILCLPPQGEPPKLGDNTGDHHIVVHVGSRVIQEVGTISYMYQSLDLYLIIGCVAGSFALILIIVIPTVIACKKRNHKKSDTPRGEEQEPVDENFIVLSPIPVNEFELEAYRK